LNGLQPSEQRTTAHYPALGIVLGDDQLFRRRDQID